jgi:hypothetical protein
MLSTSEFVNLAAHDPIYCAQPSGDRDVAGDSSDKSFDKRCAREHQLDAKLRHAHRSGCLGTTTSRYVDTPLVQELVAVGALIPCLDGSVVLMRLTCLAGGTKDAVPVDLDVTRVTIDRDRQLGCGSFADVFEGKPTHQSAGSRRNQPVLGPGCCTKARLTILFEAAKCSSLS